MRTQTLSRFALGVGLTLTLGLTACSDPSSDPQDNTTPNSHDAAKDASLAAEDDAEREANEPEPVRSTMPAQEQENAHPYPVGTPYEEIDTDKLDDELLRQALYEVLPEDLYGVTEIIDADSFVAQPLDENTRLTGDPVTVHLAGLTDPQDGACRSAVEKLTEQLSRPYMDKGADGQELPDEILGVVTLETLPGFPDTTSDGELERWVTTFQVSNVGDTTVYDAVQPMLAYNHLAVDLPEDLTDEEIEGDPRGRVQEILARDDVAGSDMGCYTDELRESYDPTELYPERAEAALMVQKARAKNRVPMASRTGTFTEPAVVLAATGELPEGFTSEIPPTYEVQAG